jgi:gliding motility-associated-like protein
VGLTAVSWEPSTGLNNPDTIAPWAAPAQTTWYFLTGTDTNSCPVVVFDSVLVSMLENFHTVSPETTIVLGTSGLVTATGGVSYQWSPTEGLGDAGIAAPVASPTVTTTYTVTIEFVGGCYTTDTVVVNVLPDPLLIFPNAFSPNGDEVNERFKPHYIGLVETEVFTIYNRWGLEVYRSNDIGEGWDGNYKSIPQDIGVFVYYYIGRSATTGKPYTFKGNLTLLR